MSADVSVPTVPSNQWDTVGASLRELVDALRAGDGAASAAWAQLLEPVVGVEAVLDAVGRTANETGRRWAAGLGSVLDERLVTSASRAVLDLLHRRVATTSGSGRLVVLACPTDDRHVLGLEVLAHYVERAGHRALVVGDLPHDELVRLAGQPDVLAVVLSVHNPLTAPTLRVLLESLRAASDTVRLAVGGPGVPCRTPASRGWSADLISSDPRALVELLRYDRASVLTPRESEVVASVAEGLTTAEIAERLCVTPATIKSHLSSVFSKTGTEHRAAAVACAIRAGWIS